MKISNLKVVNKLNEQREKCIKARLEAERFAQALEASGDGYYGYIHKHSDSSGDLVDLSGCYVSIAVANATVDILTAKITEITAELNALGIDED